MALSDENGVNTTMLVTPTSGMPAFANNTGFGGDGWWIILLFILLAGNGGFGGFGGQGGLYPWMNQAEITTGGFQNAALGTQVTAVQSDLGDIQSQLCSGFAGVNATINATSANAETAANARQMANMNQLYGLSTQFANCCCENRLGLANLGADIARENCADRAAVADGVRDILANQTANTQRILDQMCNDKIDAKNEKIADLERQLTMANLAASQTAQTARILADNTAQTTTLEQYLAPIPRPAYVVQNPNCCYNMGGCGV
jgi:hypothetical protein